MYAIIFQDGQQLPMTYNDVYALSFDKTVTVTKARTNGSQIQFTLTAGETTYTVVANCHSEGAHDLYANLGRHAA